MQILRELLTFLHIIRKRDEAKIEEKERLDKEEGMARHRQAAEQTAVEDLRRLLEQVFMH